MKNDYVIDGDSVKIKLNRRFEPSVWTTIDLADFNLVSAFKGTWCALQTCNKTRLYAMIRDGKKHLLLHIYLMRGRQRVSNKTKVVIDHIDNDSLNNKRENLRIISRQRNNLSQRLHVNNKSGYRGVAKQAGGKWTAQVRYNNRAHYLGSFTNPEDASQVVISFWEKHNLVDEVYRHIDF